MNNRAFLYGDGLFETLRVHYGQPLRFEYHLRRLQKGMRLLGLSPVCSRAQLRALIGSVDTACVEAQRVRITVYRAGDGLYTPTCDRPAYDVIAQPLALGYPSVAAKAAITYTELAVPRHALSGVKSLNAQIYVQAARYRKAQGAEEVLLLNTAGRVAEAGAANILWVEGGQFHVVAPQEGQIEGTLQAYLVDRLEGCGQPVVEALLPPERLLEAEEVYLTNAIQGIHCLASWTYDTERAVYQRKALDFLLGLL